ncbi:MAG: hypothetical protein ACYDIC_08905 [Desulfobaccales bacterium]
MMKKIILFLICLSLPLMALAGTEQTTGLTYIGKIEEIAVKSVISPVGMGAAQKYLSIKLDSKPKLDFRVTAKDAVTFHLTDTDQPSAVLAPGKLKGQGWKVRLTCEKKTTMGEPFYLVTNLERLD